MKHRILLAISLFVVLAGALPASAHVTQHCTVGFFKNHSQFLNSGTCTNFVFDQNTLVSDMFPGVDSCVGSLTFLELLKSPSSVCGDASTLPGAEIILLRQAITRAANASNSTPPSCDAVYGTITRTNAAIDDAIFTDNRQEMISLSQVDDTLNQGACTLH